jgi:hypothetical protein
MRQRDDGGCTSAIRSHDGRQITVGTTHGQRR